MFTKLKGKRLLLPYVLQQDKELNTDEIPGALSRENMISLHVKITSGVTINRILD